MANEEGMIVDIINTIKDTESSAEISFEDLKVTLPGFNLGIVMSGKVRVMVKPVRETKK